MKLSEHDLALTGPGERCAGWVSSEDRQPSVRNRRLHRATGDTHSEHPVAPRPGSLDPALYVDLGILEKPPGRGADGVKRDVPHIRLSVGRRDDGDHRAAVLAKLAPDL